MLYLSLLQTIISKDYLVPEAGLEPAHLAAGDFESPASTIPPHGHYGVIAIRTVYCQRK